MPRVNQKNKRRVDKVWVKRGKVRVWIPRIVYDCNHWMCGIYPSEKNISYYHPDIHCRRTWVPMFIQLLSMIRLNSYIFYVSHDNNNNKHYKPFITHKYFLMGIVRHFLNKAKHYDAKRQDKISR